MKNVMQTVEQTEKDLYSRRERREPIEEIIEEENSHLEQSQSTKLNGIDSSMAVSYTHLTLPTT